MTRAGVLRFPGTNCDRDVFAWAAKHFQQVDYLWHLDRFDKTKYDFIFVPGGFSYGDYLRCGALAAVSPAIQSLKEYAQYGGYVLGICNGFQILCETKLLPGVLMKNTKGNFVEGWSSLKVQTSCSFPFGKLKSAKNILLPIAHGEGNFFIDSQGLKSLHDNQQVWMTYTNNVNGSIDDIAGVSDKNHKIFGLMPHPERAMQEWMGSTDGNLFFS